MSKFHGGSRTLWRSFDLAYGLYRGSALFGGVKKRGKLWLAAYYADGAAKAAPNVPNEERELRSLGLYKSGAHAYRAVNRKLGDFKEAEDKAFLSEQPFTAPVRTYDPSKVRVFFRGQEIKGLAPNESITRVLPGARLTPLAAKVQGRGDFKVKKGRGGK